MQISMSSQLIRRRRLRVAICWQPTDFYHMANKDHSVSTQDSQKEV
uniref:Uncharacterized protein n=1 Tax=Anguilla anguilla TaxID=7936 RepID=A0A0E9RLQ8_ANGAN